MKTCTSDFTRPAVRQVILVALLAVVSALCSACHPGIKAGTAGASAAAQTSAPWQSQAPRAPLDERPITPRESAGAAED